jgi:surface protein
MAMTTIVKSLTFDGDIGDKHVVGDQSFSYVRISETPLDLASVLAVEKHDIEGDGYNFYYRNSLIDAEIEPGVVNALLIDGYFPVVVSIYENYDEFEIGTYVMHYGGYCISQVVYTSEEDVNIKTITFDGDPTGKEYVEELSLCKISDEYIDPYSIISATATDGTVTETVEYPAIEYGCDNIGNDDAYMVADVIIIVKRDCVMGTTSLTTGIYVMTLYPFMWLSSVTYWVEAGSEPKNDWFTKLFIDEAKVALNSAAVADPELQDVTLTENGEYTAEAGFDGFGVVNADVPGPVLEDVTITENGEYTVESGYDAFGTVTVSVPDPVFQNITITENGVYAVGDGYDAFGNVTVDIHNYEIPLFDTSSMTLMSYMFENCDVIETVPLFDTSKVTDMSGMFHGCSSLTTVPLFDTSNVTGMGGMFHGCSSLTTVPQFDTSNVTSMSSMFDGCTSLTTVPPFNTSNVKSMNTMFYNCVSIIEIPLFDTRNVTDMANMFLSCQGLIAVPLLSTSNVTSMYQMFSNCTSLTTVPLFDTSNVTNMNWLFNGCTSLTTVPLFDTSNVTNMGWLFNRCSSLTTVPELDIRNVTNAYNMFGDCTSLTECRVRNIQTDIQVSSYNSYGHLLTLDSLIHLIKECRDTGSNKTLTIGTVNMDKIANVYVRTVDITDAMRAEDDLIDEKLPFEVCESTDAGAMLITDYIRLKNWTIL